MESPWLDDEQQRVWRAYFQVSMLLEDTLDQQLQKTMGLPHLYYAVLVALSEAPEQRMRMTDLAETLKVTRSRITYVVTKLDRDGWVRREQADTDKRTQFTVLTKAGMLAFEQAVPGHVATVRSMVFDRLSREQTEQFGEICEIILDTLTTASRAGLQADLPWRR